MSIHPYQPFPSLPQKPVSPYRSRWRFAGTLAGLAAASTVLLLLFYVSKFEPDPCEVLFQQAKGHQEKFLAGLKETKDQLKTTHNVKLMNTYFYEKPVQERAWYVENVFGVLALPENDSKWSNISNFLLVDSKLPDTVHGCTGKRLAYIRGRAIVTLDFFNDIILGIREQDRKESKSSR